MPEAKVGGLKIFYKVRGSGRPLALIHGLGGDHTVWPDDFLAPLTARYTVITPDNRGSGRTPAGTGDFTMEQMALDIEGLLAVLDVHRAFILGHSLGGMISQRLALARPQLVDKLILCSTNCGGLECIMPDKSVIERLTDRTGTPEEQACRYISTLYPQGWLDEHADYVRGLTERYLQSVESNADVPKQFMASVKFDSCSELFRIACPTLVACGTLDNVIPSGNSRILADRIPGARLVEYADLSHDFITQVPADFAEAVISFLEERP